MAHIELPVAPQLGREFPGIVGPITFRPETAAPINDLVNILLRGESTLTRGERELIATHVSRLNDCFFCQTIHGAVAAAQLDHGEALVANVKRDWRFGARGVGETRPRKRGRRDHERGLSRNGRARARSAYMDRRPPKCTVTSPAIA